MGKSLLLTGFTLSFINVFFKTIEDAKSFKPKELLLVRRDRKLKVKLGKFIAKKHPDGYVLSVDLVLDKETIPEDKNLKAVDLIENDLIITLYTKEDSSEFVSARLTMIISNCIMQKNVEQLKLKELCQLQKPSLKKIPKGKQDSLPLEHKEEQSNKFPESSEPQIQ